MEKVKGSQGFVNHQIVHDLTNIQTKNYIYDENTNTHINKKNKSKSILTNEVKIKLENKIKKQTFRWNWAVLVSGPHLWCLWDVNSHF